MHCVSNMVFRMLTLSDHPKGPIPTKKGPKVSSFLVLRDARGPGLAGHPVMTFHPLTIIEFLNHTRLSSAQLCSTLVVRQQRHTSTTVPILLPQKSVADSDTGRSTSKHFLVLH